MPAPDLPEAAHLVGEDIAYQRRVWRVQRIGWVVMAAFVAAALTGILGNGPLAHGHARSDDGVLEADWERVIRIGRDARLVLRATRPSRLVLEGDLVEALDVTAVDPPIAARARARERYVFEVAPDGGAPGEVVLHALADAPGLLSATLSDGTRSLRLRVVVLP